MPLAQLKTMRERRASARAVLRRRDQACNCSHSDSLNTNSAFGRPLIAPPSYRTNYTTDNAVINKFHEFLTQDTSSTFMSNACTAPTGTASKYVTPVKQSSADVTSTDGFGRI